MVPTKLTLIAGAPGTPGSKDALGFLELLTTLKQKKEIFVKLGIAVYQKIRQVQGSGKIRKGSIVDEKV